MEYVNSFNAIKSNKAYLVKVKNLHPDNDSMTFHIDSGASVTFLGIDSFCSPKKKDEYDLLYGIVEKEINRGGFEKYKTSAQTVTKEEIDAYPCKYDGVSVSGTKPITLYFCIYLGDIGIPLLGFDYIDDCSYQHGIGGDLIFTAVAEKPGKRFYPEKLIDFNKVLKEFSESKH